MTKPLIASSRIFALAMLAFVVHDLTRPGQPTRAQERVPAQLAPSGQGGECFGYDSGGTAAPPSMGGGGYQ